MVTAYSKFENSVKKSMDWIHQLKEFEYIDSDETALSVLRIVLQALRDRMTTEESAHMSAQLPIAIRGLFFEGWRPTEQPKDQDALEFIRAVQDELERRNQTISAEQAIPAVFEVVRTHITEGEVEHIKTVLPKGIQEYWPGQEAA